MEIVSDIIGLVLLAGIVAIPVFFVAATIRNIRRSRRWPDGNNRRYSPRTPGSAGFDGMDYADGGGAQTQTPSHAAPHPPQPAHSPCDLSPHHAQADHASWFDHHAAPDCSPSHSGSSFDSGSSYDSGGSFSGGFDSGGSFDGGGGGDSGGG